MRLMSRCVAVGCVLSGVMSLGLTTPAFAQCQLQKLLAEDGEPGDQHGDSVSIDGPWMIVGSSRADEPVQSTGSAVIYFNTELGWEEYATLLPPDPAVNDLFGWSVDIDADAPGGAVAIVGAYLNDDAAEDAGAVHVYRLVDGLPDDEWLYRTTLTASDASPGDQFGEAIALEGTTIAVGAARTDVGDDANAGAVYVFELESDTPPETWLEVDRLVRPSDRIEEQDRLGVSVAIDTSSQSGRFIVAGASFADPEVGGQPVNSAGVAEVFVSLSGGPWNWDQTLLSDNPQENDKFGEAVAISGSVVMVGAPFDDEIGAGSSNAGAVMVFSDGGLQWDFIQRLASPQIAAGNQFGSSIDIAPNGILAIVGAPQANSQGAFSGAAFAFRDESQAWMVTEERLVPQDGAANDRFGNSVSISDNFIAVGASNDDNERGVNAGAAYLYSDATASCSDCNFNLIVDSLEIMQTPELDCNEDGILDACQIAFDSPAPGGPFYCETDCDQDCNDNGILDICDIESGLVADDDGDGIPDICQDCNNNGVPDSVDIAEGTASDCNFNDIPDDCDVAPGGGFEDCDGNGLPDECDLDNPDVNDCNGNDIPDTCEDCDGNGLADECDLAGGAPDVNRDGILDACQDCDNSGIPDFVEVFIPGRDCNNNEILDVCEINENTPGGDFYCTEDCDPDCNVNGVPDECDIADGVSEDVDGNGVPDECEDCNNNNIPDGMDISDGTETDCDGDGVPDRCQISFASDAPGGPFYCTFGCDADCNDNGIPDECDILDATSEDCDSNGVPDECDPDCNSNGTPDGCDIIDGTSSDFDGNNVPDECDPDCDGDGVSDFLEIFFGTEEDCDENEIPDSCDIANGAPDSNHNGIPDGCENLAGDLDLNGIVNFQDLLSLLNAWGNCPGTGSCAADIDEDGIVGFNDLVLMLNNWS